MYINVISGQPSHHLPDDEGGDDLRNVGLLSTPLVAREDFIEFSRRESFTVFTHFLNCFLSALF
jgi:hypothetical protein